jgi:hypothetical protein
LILFVTLNTRAYALIKTGKNQANYGTKYPIGIDKRPNLVQEWAKGAGARYMGIIL